MRYHVCALRDGGGEIRGMRALLLPDTGKGYERAFLQTVAAVFVGPHKTLQIEE